MKVTDKQPHTEHYFVVRGFVNDEGNIEFDFDGATANARFSEGYIWDGYEWDNPNEKWLVERDIAITKALQDRIHS